MRIHIVQKGDTLWKIARQHGISFEDLKRLNAHLANPDYIVPGMEIYLPDGTVKEATQRQAGKEHTINPPVKEYTGEKVKEYKREVAPVKEAPMKEMPIKEQPLPVPLPMPVPQPPVIMPIEMHWTPPVQAAPTTQIDLYNLNHMPDINVQMETPQPIVMPQQPPQPIQLAIPTPQQPIHDQFHTTHYIHVPMPIPVPVPVHVPHVIQPPCDCHAKLPEPPCGCREVHPMHQQPHHHMPCYSHQQPWHFAPQGMPMPWGNDQNELSGLESMPPISPMENMPLQQMPGIDGQMEGWRFPESSSYSNDLDLREQNERPHFCPPQSNVSGIWEQDPMNPYRQPHWGFPGCVPPHITPYEYGYVGHPYPNISPWMMPYK